MAQERYILIFGRTPQLAARELQTFIPGATVLSEEIALIESKETIDAGQLMDKLGGTVKIARVVGQVSEVTPQSVISFIDTRTKSVTFGFSIYGFDLSIKTMTAHVKELLEQQAVRTRYVTPAHGNTLSTVVVEKGNVQELIIVKHDNSYIVAATLAVQAFEAWNMRDYGRPYADAKSGMLPPKVARMIVNIALPKRSGGLIQPPSFHPALLDPFCGMGTVLAEAYMTSWSVMGSDVSADIVARAGKNLDWLVHAFPNTGGSVGSCITSDAVHISEHIAAGSIDAIVTEPFMGATSIANQKTLDSKKIKNIIKGLEKLYIGCLRDWHKILKENGRIVIALPAYAILGRVYFVKKVVDMCENLGYTIVDGPIEYSRPQAIVKRQFYILEKKS